MKVSQAVGVQLVIVVPSTCLFQETPPDTTPSYPDTIVVDIFHQAFLLACSSNSLSLSTTFSLKYTLNPSIPSFVTIRYVPAS